MTSLPENLNMKEGRKAESNIKLSAVGSGREIDFDSPGLVTLLICYAQQTEAGAEPLELALREHHPDISKLLVAHLIDLHKLPGLFRKAAEVTLDSEYKKAVAALDPGQPAADHVVILADWDGAAVQALGLSGVEKKLGLAVLDRSGTVVGTDQSDDLTAGALRLLSTAFT